MDTRKVIVGTLEGKKEAEILGEEYNQVSDELVECLRKLKGWGSECNCKDSYGIKTVRMVHSGNGEDKVFVYCLECGGLVFEPTYY
jgi:hypothetical protein